MRSPSADHPVAITWREPLEADLESCLQNQPHALGHDLVGRQRALEVWKTLLRTRTLISRIVERTDVNGRRHAVGFGASVFAAQEFVSAEIHNPAPGLPSRMIAARARGETSVLARRQVADANAAAGLDVVFLASVWWTTSNQIEFSEMMMASVGSCVEAHAGYRLRSVLVEITGDQLRTVGNQSGEMEIIKVFDDLDRALVRLTRAGASAVAGSFSNLLFHHREPRLGFRDSEQQLLTRALSGATDGTLATDLRLGVTTVKKRWRAIFGKVEDLAPELLAHVATGDGGKRGPQKRHFVLEYVRKHPEELRPFARIGVSIPSSRAARAGG